MMLIAKGWPAPERLMLLRVTDHCRSISASVPHRSAARDAVREG
jgi:hypothetical protein